jgi:NADPH:quinone reductase-like Zn-dependent oxidoreductase
MAINFPDFGLTPEQRRELIGRHLTVKGFFLGDYDHVSKLLPAPVQAAPLVASGALTVPVAAVYPIDEIKEPPEHIHKDGKILSLGTKIKPLDICSRRSYTEQD